MCMTSLLGPSLQRVEHFKAELAKKVKIKDLREVSYFLGVRILRNRKSRTVTLMQDAFLKRVLEAKGWEKIKPATTPLAPGSLKLAVPNTGDTPHYTPMVSDTCILTVQYPAVSPHPLVLQSTF